MKGMGKGLKSFKKGLKESSEKDTDNNMEK